MNLKKKIIMVFVLITIVFLSIVNLKNTSKTQIFLLNFKSEKITLGNIISLSFLTGFITTFTFLRISNTKNENQLINDETFNIKTEFLQDDTRENINEEQEEVNERPPQRDIRDSQPTISVNYRVIKKNNEEFKDIDNVYGENENKNYDDWDELDSNWQ
tara:strand:- start:238 stop:714 length:477 start_codon:yes stop_codon:yes gene_type:complete